MSVMTASLDEVPALLLALTGATDKENLIDVTQKGLKLEHKTSIKT